MIKVHFLEGVCLCWHSLLQVNRKLVRDCISKKINHQVLFLRARSGGNNPCTHLTHRIIMIHISCVRTQNHFWSLRSLKGSYLTMICVSFGCFLWVWRTARPLSSTYTLRMWMRKFLLLPLLFLNQFLITLFDCLCQHSFSPPAPNFFLLFHTYNVQSHGDLLWVSHYNGTMAPWCWC